MSRNRLRAFPLLALVLAVAAGAARAAEAPPVTALKTQKVGESTYFRVSFKVPANLDLRPIAAGDQDDPAEARCRLLARLPRLVPQDGGTAAVYLDLPPQRPAGLASLDFVGKVTAQGPARFLLLYPTRLRQGEAPARAEPAWAQVLQERTWTEVPVTLDFTKVAAPADGDGLKKAWAGAQARHFAVLELMTPDFGFYGFARAATGRKYDVKAPAIVASPASPDDTFARLYEMTTGAAALTESLALRRLLAPTPMDRSRRTIDVARLPDVGVPEHPWQAMMAGKKPEPEPLAALVPHDQYYVTFRSADSWLAFADLLDQWGGLVLNAFEVRGRDYRLRQRYEKQLCLDSARLVRTLDPLVLHGVAVTGSDPYLREGSDVTVIFHVAERKPLLDALDLLLAGPRKELGNELREAKEDYQGIAVESFVGPLREVSLYRAAAGEFVICSNSPVALRRVLDVQRGKRPALANSPDFRYMRTVFRRGDGKEDGFAFLSDAFIRRLVGPANKIKEKRRLEALASLSLVTHGALFAGWETGRLPRDHKELLRESGLRPEEIAMPEGKGAAWDAGRRTAVSDAYNTLHFATPLVELPLDRVTPEEAREYEAFRQQYLGLWRRYFDPVGIRLVQDERRIRAEALILPLVQTSAYSGLRMLSGEKTVVLDAATFSPTTVFAFVTAFAPGFLLGGPDGPYTAQLRLDDSLAYRDLVGLWIRHQLQPLKPSEYQREAADLLQRLPLSFTVRVTDARQFTDQLKQLQTLIEGGDRPVKFEPLPKPHRGATITRVTIPTESGLARELRETLPEVMHGFIPGFYHALLDDVWYVSASEDALRKLMDEEAARRAGKGPAQKEVHRVSSAVHIAPAGKAASAALNLFLEWETHRRAVGNGPLWYALHHSQVLAPDAGDAARREAALRFLGFVPVSPDGSAYRYDRAADEVVSARHGSWRRPDLHAVPEEGSPLLSLLDRLRTVRADLTFRADGAQTVVTIDRATPAEAKAERTAPGASVRRLGGRVVIDERDAGRPVVKAELRGSAVGDTDLAGLRGLEGLRELDLGSTWVTDQGLRGLHGFTRLQRVYLDGTGVTDAGADALRKVIPGVQVVRWTDAEQRAQAAVERLGGRYETDLRKVAGELLSVNLAATKADDRVLALLKGMDRLGTLDLRKTAVTDAGLEHLHGLARLQRVYVDRTGVTDAGADAFRKALPGVQVVRWTDAEQRAQAAVERLGGRYETDLRKVAGELLSVNLAATKADDRVLALLKGMDRLETLDLRKTAVTDAGLAQLHGLARLQRVYLDDTPVTDAGEKALRAAVPGARVFRKTDRERVILQEIGRLGGTLAVATPEAGGEVLGADLSWTRATDATLELLKDLPHLRILNLDNTAVTDAGLKHLQGLKSLTWVGTEATGVTDAGAAAFGKARPEVTVRRRDDLQQTATLIDRLGRRLAVERSAGGKREVTAQLMSSRITAADIAQLNLLGNVRSLNLAHTAVTDADLAPVVQMKSLRALDLTATKITDSGLEMLRRLPELRDLNLSKTEVTNEGLAHLKGMTSLRKLTLYCTDISDKGVVHLKGLTRLEDLNLMTTLVTGGGVREIQESLPKLKISR